MCLKQLVDMQFAYRSLLLLCFRSQMFLCGRYLMCSRYHFATGEIQQPCQFSRRINSLIN
jgi:hypothetical protein